MAGPVPEPYPVVFDPPPRGNERPVLESDPVLPYPDLPHKISQIFSLSSPEIWAAKQDTPKINSGNKCTYCPTVRSGRSRPLPNVELAPPRLVPVLPGAWGRGLLVSSGSFTPDEPIIVEPD